MVTAYTSLSVPVWWLWNDERGAGIQAALVDLAALTLGCSPQTDRCHRCHTSPRIRRWRPVLSWSCWWRSRNVSPLVSHDDSEPPLGQLRSRHVNQTPTEVDHGEVAGREMFCVTSGLNLDNPTTHPCIELTTTRRNRTSSCGKYKIACKHNDGQVGCF